MVKHILEIPMEQIEETHHGKPQFDNFHGTNQGKAPAQNEFLAK